jgi:hypothetical protein
VSDGYVYRQRKLQEDYTQECRFRFRLSLHHGILEGKLNGCTQMQSYKSHGEDVERSATKKMTTLKQIKDLKQL